MFGTSVSSLQRMAVDAELPESLCQPKGSSDSIKPGPIVTSAEGGTPWGAVPADASVDDVGLGLPRGAPSRFVAGPRADENPEALEARNQSVRRMASRFLTGHVTRKVRLR